MDQTNSRAPFTQPTPSSVSARIRSQRKMRRLTLHDVERISEGRIKAVVMGSYERGTRAISLARTIEIANLFGIPVSELITNHDFSKSSSTLDLVFDLRKVNELKERANNGEMQALDRYLKAITVRRRDWNGEVLSLRNSDLDTLTLLIGSNVDELLRSWIETGLLLKAPNHP
jgi:transcriptional regulator with XRE-family HTH domain